MLLSLPVIPLLSYIPPKSYPLVQPKNRPCRQGLRFRHHATLEVLPLDSPARFFGKSSERTYRFSDENFRKEVSVFFSATNLELFWGGIDQVPRTMVIGLRGGCPPPSIQLEFSFRRVAASGFCAGVLNGNRIANNPCEAV